MGLEKWGDSGWMLLPSFTTIIVTGYAGSQFPVLLPDSQDLNIFKNEMIE